MMAEGTISAVTNLIIVAGVVLALAAYVKTRRVVPAIGVLLTTGIAAIAITFAPSLSEKVFDVMRDPDPTASPNETTPAPTVAPAPDPQVPASSTNWGEVWMVVGIIAVSLLVLVFIFWLATTLMRRSKVAHREYIAAREKALVEKERQLSLLADIESSWLGATGKHAELDAEYLSYQKELSLIAKYPLMTDLTAPLTVKAVQAMTEARNCRPARSPRELEPVERYRTAVNTYEVALRAAVANAKREGLRNFSEKEQKDLRLAQALLRMAEDKAGSPHERRSAYEQAIKTLRGVLGEVPREAISEIEARAKQDGLTLAITA